MMGGTPTFSLAVVAEGSNDGVTWETTDVSVTIVGEVSGKGADASQFMVLSKTLWKSVALRLGAPLAQIQQTVNAEIIRENSATMFVTGLCGLIDVETGVLSYSSAGHDSPYLVGPGQPPVQLPDYAGPPVGLAEDVAFPVGEAALSPGDRL